MIADAIVSQCESGEREYVGGVEACRQDAPCRGEVWWAYIKSVGGTSEEVGEAVDDWEGYTEDSPVFHPILSQRSECSSGSEFLGEEAVQALDAWVEMRGTITVNKPCDDLGGYSDIMRLQIIVYDAQDNYISKLEPSPFNGTSLIESDFADWCIASFSAEDVAKHDVYKVDTGRRGTFFYEVDELNPDLFGGVKLFELEIG